MVSWDTAKFVPEQLTEEQNTCLEVSKNHVQWYHDGDAFLNHLVTSMRPGFLILSLGVETNSAVEAKS
jgi:hypothetical protein